MSISEPFIRRPVATTLLTAALALSGALAFRFLPVSALPEVDFPTISVGASLPGASPETMASAVATPLERQFGRISGVTEMTSTSYLGSTSITLQFDLSRNIDAAARDVQAAINAARAQLPANLPSNPSYRKVNPADSPVMILALQSDTFPIGKVYDAASSVLQQKLSQVEGVGQVFVGGGALPAVRVELNPTALNKYGIGLDEVRTALAAANVNRPKGELSDGNTTWQINTTDQLLHAAEYRPLIVAYRQGAAVRVADVGTVEDSVENTLTLGLANGKPSVLIIVFREPGANIIATVDRVRALLPQLQASISPAMHLLVASDRTTTIRASIADVEFALLLSVVLVVLVVFLFLRSASVTLIPGVAVPLSLAGTFGVMYLLGYSLDNLSLMALTISTGFVIDDAIVVVENISRYVEQGLSPMDAALIGSREIGFTVVSMSTSLVAVFLPILLMGGIVGRLFREFAVTLAAAITISLVVSLTTTPMMCSRILSAKGSKQQGRLFRASERAFDSVYRGYESGLRWVLQHRRLTLTLTVLTVCLNVYLYILVPKGFFPQQDTGFIVGNVQARQDISFESMRQKLMEFVKIVMSDPAVENVVAFTGGSGSTTNTARMFVSLKPLEERGRKVDQIIPALRGKLSKVAGASLFLQASQDVRVGGRAGNAQYQYTVQADSLGELKEWAPRILAALRQLPELADVNIDQQDRGLQAYLDLDRDSAARMGISARLIDQALYDAFGQRQVSTMYTRLNQYHVVMEAAPAYRKSPETLTNFYVPSASGAQVPLVGFTRYQPSQTALAVNHQGQFPAVTISFNLAAGAALGDAVTAIDGATQRIGLPMSILGSFQGTAQAFQDSLKNQPMLILAALVTVYIVLGVLYESYIHPITILSTLPSAGVGAILALLICRTELSVIALIGIILLIGIVKKNAILMIDFAIQAEREQGNTPEEAIYQACLLRFRPILMTTMAALLGGLPVALSSGTGSELRRPLGIAIVGGLLVSQMLTLFTTPIVYLYLDSFRLWFGRSRRVIATAVTMLLLCGCAAGPKYNPPSAPVPPAYKEVSNDGWKPAEPSDRAIRGKWWEILNDPQLNALEERVDVSNQNVQIAEAQFRQARAFVRFNRAGLFPTVTASPAITASHPTQNRAFAPGVPAGTFHDYVLPIDVSYEADVWGRVRNTIAGSVASAQATAADLENVRLSMQAELGVDYVQLRALDAERQLLDSTAAAYERALQLTIDRHNGGIASGADVAQAQTQLETTRAQATDVGVQRAQFEHAIAVLVGEPPETFSMAGAALAGPPPQLPPGVPSELLERRPDIAAAERAVASENAAIGVAKSAYFPSLLLAASGGLESSRITTWLSWPSRVWSLGPTLAETLFDGGRRKATVEQSEAAYDAAVAQYRQTVLAAFEEVEDSLAALRILDREAREQEAAVAAARKSLQVSTDQYKGGVASYLQVVTAQSTLLANERAAVDILQRRMTDTVVLIKALGGGWDASKLPSPQDLRSFPKPRPSASGE